MKYQTEAEAFRAIAEKFITGKRHYKKLGICAEAKGERNAGNITPDLATSIALRCMEYLPYGSTYAYGFDYYKWSAIQDDEARALACLWMAHEAEEEG